jgi:hypothetical protein
MERIMLSDVENSRILRKLPRDKSFYFFTSIGNYTGEWAASLEDFVKKIPNLDVKSLEFHLYRGDFEKWVGETLEDNTLVYKIKQLKALKPIGIDLRDRLYLIVFKHFESVKKPSSTSFAATSRKSNPTIVSFEAVKSQNVREISPSD